MATLIGEWLPRYDFSEHHEVICAADRRQTYSALRTTDLLRSRSARFLVALRGLASHGWTIDELVSRTPFVILDETSGEEIVLGLVGRPWRPGGDLVEVDPEGFRSFSRAGFARMAWNFRTEDAVPGTRLSTETRIHCTDARSRRSFRRYWMLVGPLSGFIRSRMLATVKAAAESGRSG